MVVFIPKGDIRYFQGGVIVEVLCNTIMGLLDRCFTLEIRFHDVLHGFWEERGTGTASRKTNLLQQIMATREAVIHNIFLGLHQTYGVLERDSYLEILARCGVVPRAIQIFWAYCGCLTRVAKSMGYYGPPFNGYRVLTQG